VTEVDSDLRVRLQRALSRYPEIQLAILFGSHAQQRASAASDIDLAVSAPGTDLQALSGNLSSELGAEVDVVSLEAATIPLLEALIQDGIVVAQGRRDAGAAWRSKTLALLETDRPFYHRMRDAWLRRIAERGL
jgi:predicted nucleotidyltransferase